MSDPKISVIVATYNVEDYIEETMDSLLGQTFPPSEIVIVNDGSTDGTLALVNSKYADDSRVKVITQENQGVGAARVTGFNAATGDYLFFCDPDDVVDLNLFEGLKTAVKRMPTWSFITFLNDLSSILMANVITCDAIPRRPAKAGLVRVWSCWKI